MSHDTQSGTATPDLSATSASIGTRPALPSAAPTDRPAVKPGAEAFNGFAVAALPSAVLVAPVGIVFGHIALKQIKTRHQKGHGLALTGAIVGYVFTSITALMLLVGMIIGAIAVTHKMAVAADCAAVENAQGALVQTYKDKVAKADLTNAETAPAVVAAFAAAEKKFMSETNTVSATELQPVMKHVRTSITDFGNGLAGPPLDAHGDETMTLDENLQHAADAWNQSTAELGRVCGDSLATNTTVSIDEMGS